jgi:cbb3-type cytochrome oxidase subunit 3
VVVAASAGAVAYGVFLLVAIVIGFILVAVLWYFMVYKPSRQERYDKERRADLSDGEPKP